MPCYTFQSKKVGFGLHLNIIHLILATFYLIQAFSEIKIVLFRILNKLSLRLK
jgi:hypothetical protein